MDVRDVFAAVALHAMIRKLPMLDLKGEHGATPETTLSEVREEIARCAYNYADAMLQMGGRGVTPGPGVELPTGVRLRHG